MRSLTARQKRAVAGATEPLVGLAFRGYRALSRRDPAPGLRALQEPEAAAAVRKILAVRLDAIGDLLLSEPALEILRTRFPNARIDLIANPSSAALLRGCPNIDRLITYRAPWHSAWRGEQPSWHREVGRFWGLTRVLRREFYDLGFELRGDVRDIVFMAAAGPRALAGTGFRGGSRLLDWDTPFPQNAHQVEISVAIASAGGPPNAARAPRVYLDESHRSRAAQALGDVSRSHLIGLHLGAGFPSKMLPLETFATAIRALQVRNQAAAFIVVGSPDETPLVEGLQRLAKDTRIIDLTGALSLLETAAVLEQCSLFIGNDSAPMHLAAAVGTPIVTFFGPSEPSKFHPYGVPYRLLEVDLECRPCDYVHCVWPDDLRYQCMTRQSPDAIIQAVQELLAGKLTRTTSINAEQNSVT